MKEKRTINKNRIRRVKIALPVLIVAICMLINISGSVIYVNAMDVNTVDINAMGVNGDSTAANSANNNIVNNAGTGNNIDPNGTLGKNSDVGVEVTESIKGVAGKDLKVSFKLVSGKPDTIKLKSVYPVIDTTFPFETSGDAYKIEYAGDDVNKQAALDAEYTLKVRSDLEDGYQSVRFIGEYTKIAADGSSSDFYVIKTINIYFSATEPTTATTQSSTSKKSSSSKKETTTTESDDDDDDDTGSSSSSSYSGYSGSSSSSSSSDDDESTPPKLIIEGFDTDPEKVMAGSSFKMKIHVKNSSDKTNVCNGKFLIGDESGNFLPVSGSNAVFVDKIEAGKTGDLEIELKTTADLPQKNYRLMIKGDFDDSKGNNFSASESVYLTVYQEVKMNVTDVTLTPESIGIGSSGSLVFTINNQGSAGVYNISVSTADEAVAAVESYVGNIAANSSAYATLEVTGKQDNSDKGTIKVKINYEDSEGNKGELEQDVPCLVGVDAAGYDDYEDYEEFEDDEDEEIPWWVWLIIGLVAAAIIIVVIVIVVKKRKAKLQKLMEEEDEAELFGDENSEADKVSENVDKSGEEDESGDNNGDVSSENGEKPDDEDTEVIPEEETEVIDDEDIPTVNLNDYTRG